MLVNRYLPKAMVHDDSSKVVEVGPQLGAPRLGQVGHDEVRHVQSPNWELDESIDLGLSSSHPTEPLQVQNQHLQWIINQSKKPGGTARFNSIMT